MNQRDNILQELNELESTLGGSIALNVYQVPGGYFEGFAANVLNRIKAMEADNSGDEINFLSPFLSKVSKINPYSVPDDYFESLETRLMQIVKSEKDQTVDEELKELSPLLSGLKKQTPYSIPEGYFDNLKVADIKKETAPKAKVVSIGSRRKWFRYAAAAVIISFVTLGTFLFLNKKETINPETNSYAWVKNNMKKVSTEELDKFITVTEKETPAVAINTGTNDIKDLMKNISDKDIQNFLDDADVAETDIDDLPLN